MLWQIYVAYLVNVYISGSVGKIKYLKMMLEMPSMQIPGTMEPRRHMAGLLQLPLNGDPWDLKGELSEDNNAIECHCWRWSLADNCMP